MLINFPYYLHNSYSKDEIQEVFGEYFHQLGESQQEALIGTLYEKVYELKLDCTYDTQTGTIDIEVAK